MASGRLEFGWREPPREDYLRLYRGIDIAMDLSLCNGMMTSCDTLWMGVPVLTLPGQSPDSRATLNLLKALGLEELEASGEDDFVRLGSA